MAIPTIVATEMHSPCAIRLICWAASGRKLIRVVQVMRVFCSLMVGSLTPSQHICHHGVRMTSHHTCDIFAA